MTGDVTPPRGRSDDEIEAMLSERSLKVRFIKQGRNAGRPRWQSWFVSLLRLAEIENDVSLD